MRRTRLIATICALGAVIALTACTPTSSEPQESPSAGVSESAEPTPSVDPAWSETLTPVWQQGIVPLSEPVVVGDTVLMYVAGTDGTENMVALDAATGEQRWSQHALPGVEAPGVRHEVATATIGDAEVVAFLTDGPVPPVSNPNPGWSALTLVDIATGKPVASHLAQTALWASRPEACGDTVCVSAETGTSDVTLTYAFDPASGTLTTQLPPGTPYLEGGRFLDGPLSETRIDGVEYLRYGVDGALRWSVPYEQVFAPGYTSDFGWSWRTEEGEPLIGWGRPNKDLPPTGDYSYDYAAVITVALSPEDGSRLWAAPGVTTCGGVETFRVIDGVVIACHFHSATLTVSRDAAGTPSMAASQLSYDLVGLDLATGKPRWTLPLGDDPRTIGYESNGLPAVLGSEGTVLASIDGRAVTVDPATGTPSDIPSGAALLCASDGPRPKLIGPFSDSDQNDTYFGAPILSACSDTGTAQDDATISAGTLAATGHEGLSVLNLRSGLTALNAGTE